MDILVPAHYSVFSGGIATLARGLLHALPRYADPGIRIVVPPVPPRREALTHTASARSALARLGYEQLQLAAAARRVDTVHLLDARPIVASRTPFVLTVHDVGYLDHPEWYPAAVARYKALMLRAALFQRPAAIVCDSHYGKERLLRHHRRLAARADVVVIAPGVEAPPAADAAGAGHDAPYFVTVGAIEPRRNHLTLLDAFGRARAAGLTSKWVVVGPPGHLSAPIVEQLRAAAGVEVRGAVSADELERLYRGALFAVTPSLAEGFGYPPLEAMTRGVPVACSRGSALDETVADAAVRVAARDAEDWATALLRLEADHALRERLIARGRAQSERFGWERAARALLAVHRAIR